MLAELAEHFSVKVVSEVFGDELISELKSARVVINIHYYENALLEMPRIQECLSIGIPVVSEGAQDQGDYPELAGAVNFFEEGSVSGMVAAVRAALDRQVSDAMVSQAVESGGQRFNFMFDRFLIAMGFLSATHAKSLSLQLPALTERVALSLPETFSRRVLLEAALPRDTIIFDGIRRNPGWVGCGLSYYSLANNAIANKMKSLTVMEDDVVLPQDFEYKIKIIQGFLSSREGQWDIFSGVIAALHPDAKVLDVTVYEGLTFATINRMTSMVFNIYGEKALELLASWDPENLDAATNTIDRYLESKSELRVVVTMPFFVGHREEVNSTLWGFNNRQYVEMISQSQKSLRKKVDQFLHGKSSFSTPA